MHWVMNSLFSLKYYIPSIRYFLYPYKMVVHRDSPRIRNQKVKATRKQEKGMGDYSINANIQDKLTHINI